MTEMLAARFERVGEPLRLESLAIPTPAEGEVLVAVRACGLCGTDLHIAVDGDLAPSRVPITLGHEPAGVVADANGDAELRVGDRVGLLPAASCGACRFCRDGREPLCDSAQVYGMDRDGALAEYIAVPARATVALPDEVPFEIGAIATDAVATPFHALRCRGRLRPGETVGVFGCGGIGTHAILLARLLGAGRIVAVDTEPAALERALVLGADAIVDARADEAAREVRARAGGGLDLALECVGLAAATEQALRSLAKGGRAVLVGVGPSRPALPSLYAFVGREQAVLASYGAHRADLEEVYALAAGGRLDLSGSISARYPLAEAPSAFARLARREGDVIRLVVEPGAAG